jgi:TetR/AcrR family transcriptional regulator
VLGVTKPTLYQYFKSKQELLYACHQIAMESGEAGLALATAHQGTGREKLLVYLRRYMQGIFGDLGNCPVVTDVDSLGPEFRGEVVARRRRISQATQDLIAGGIADGSISDLDPKLATLFALGVVNWILVWYRDTGPNTPDEIMDTFVSLLISGLQPK